MIHIAAVLYVAGKRQGPKQIFMKPKRLSWNMRGLNEVDKWLKVRNLLRLRVGEYVVACSFKNIADNFTWAFARVYGPNIDSSRRSLWEELVGFALVHQRRLQCSPFPLRRIGGNLFSSCDDGIFRLYF
jgi:hypothetical protein